MRCCPASAATDELLASLGPVVGLARVARGEMSREAYWSGGATGAARNRSCPPQARPRTRTGSTGSWRPLPSRRWTSRHCWRSSAPSSRPPGSGSGALSPQGQVDAAAIWRGCRGAPACAKRSAPRARGSSGWSAPGPARRRADRPRRRRLFPDHRRAAGPLAGKDAPTATIPARRQTYERYRALPPYPLIIRGRFDPSGGRRIPNGRSDIYDSHGLLPTLRLKAPRENVILGMPGSAGRVEGLVRRLDSPEEGDQLQPGEILVTSQTNIGWTLLFPRAAAVVTDVGAPLSHAAIVARELGIPAVVGCGDATTRLRTGDRVRVDGGQGRWRYWRMGTDKNKQWRTLRKNQLCAGPGRSRGDPGDRRRQGGLARPVEGGLPVPGGFRVTTGPTALCGRE